MNHCESNRFKGAIALILLSLTSCYALPVPTGDKPVSGLDHLLGDQVHLENPFSDKRMKCYSNPGRTRLTCNGSSGSVFVFDGEERELKGEKQYTEWAIKKENDKSHVLSWKYTDEKNKTKTELVFEDSAFEALIRERDNGFNLEDEKYKNIHVKCFRASDEKQGKQWIKCGVVSIYDKQIGIQENTSALCEGGYANIALSALIADKNQEITLLWQKRLKCR